MYTKNVYNHTVLVLCFILLLISLGSCRTVADFGVLCNGEEWLDTDGNPINAHGGGVLYHKGTYYWYGEHKSDFTTAAMVGITCYASKDLRKWKNCGVALSVVDSVGHDLERGCVMERPKVIYNETTKQFVMWLHLELKGKGYSAARTAVAVSDNPKGPFRYLRSMRVNADVLPFDMSDGQRDEMMQLNPDDYKK
jgi:hypothetical protein